MARINLLPWRDWERRRSRNRFIGGLAVACAIGILVVLVVSRVIAGQIDQQRQVNIYLRQDIAKLDKKIQAIRGLKKTRSALLSRMKVIERLQRSRPLVVHLFDQLVKTVPNDVYLVSVKNENWRLTINGIADSPAGVSDYMHDISQSRWLDSPSLEVVRTGEMHGESRSRFTVTTKVRTPKHAKTTRSSAQGVKQ